MYIEKKNNITVFIEVYNEASRLEACLKSFTWAEELVVFVKKSNDLTLSIAKQYATHVYEVDYCSASENFERNIKSHKSKEWCLFITASSLIDPELAFSLVEFISKPNFNYDVVGIPYQMLVFGVGGNFSPWGGEYKYSLIRRNKLLLSNVLHKEISWEGNNIIKMDSKTTIGRFYHCTHADPDDMFLRHLRYVKYEAKYLVANSKNNSMRLTILGFLRSIANVMIKKRTVFKGIDGFVLSMAYISYFIMRIVYVWFERRNINNPYDKLRNELQNKWDHVKINTENKINK